MRAPARLAMNSSSARPRSAKRIRVAVCACDLGQVGQLTRGDTAHGLEILERAGVRGLKVVEVLAAAMRACSMWCRDRPVVYWASIWLSFDPCFFGTAGRQEATTGLSPHRNARGCRRFCGWKPWKERVAGIIASPPCS